MCYICRKDVHKQCPWTFLTCNFVSSHVRGLPHPIHSHAGPPWHSTLLLRGSIGVWNEIHPYLGGVGFASVVVCFLVGVYYNMIIAWCFYYLFASFQDPLPYSECPMVNMTIKEECRLAGRTQYYWYKNALDTSPSIEESGGLTWHLCLVLLLAWVVVFLCTMKGVQSAGKVTLFTARNTCLIGTVTG